MEPILPAVIFVAGVGGALAWLASRRHRREPRRQDLMRFDGPSCKAAVHTGRTKAAGRMVDYTECAAQLPWTQGAMRVGTSDWCGPLEPFFGARDVRIGHPETDDRYVIQGAPETLPRRVLDEPTLDRLWHLHAMGAGPFLLVVRPSQLVVRVSRRLEAGPELQGFVDECFAIVSRLLSLPDPESGTGAVVVQPNAQCQVCGTTIEAADRVLCRKCRTAHHADCWAYNNGCSTFGCGERRSVRG
ncbi:MAG: hypothetical protein HYY16_11295 [Planctomycetes bacterium]|nr:hypothetical protein [Planctomycetota bacterium]